jgi:hypothetical protein
LFVIVNRPGSAALDAIMVPVIVIIVKGVRETPEAVGGPAHTV